MPEGKDKVQGQDIPGTSGPTRRDVPDPDPGMSRTKTMQGAAVLGNGWDVPRFGSGSPGIRKTLCKETLG